MIECPPPGSMVGAIDFGVIERTRVTAQDIANKLPAIAAKIREASINAKTAARDAKAAGKSVEKAGDSLKIGLLGLGGFLLAAGLVSHKTRGY